MSTPLSTTPLSTTPSSAVSLSTASSSAVSHRRWPASPLAAAARAFDLLTCGPDPLTFDARGLPVLPQRILPLDELRDLLTADSTPKPVRDLVWRDLVPRARRDGPTWVVATVGIAMPGLRMKAGLLTRRWHGDTADLDAELITGFVERLKTIDLDAPRICGRLIDAGARAVKRSRLAEEEASAVHVDMAWSRTPSGPWDHPDWVLTRAVAAAVIDPEEHLLIGQTRLDEIPLSVVAGQLGISPTLAASWRGKAERRLAAAIASGELDWETLHTCSAATDARRRRAYRARVLAAAGIGPAQDPTHGPAGTAGVRGRRAGGGRRMTGF
jgi:hypothetical protein